MTAATEQESGLARRLNGLRRELRERDEAQLERNTGARLVNGRFLLKLWGAAVEVAAPAYVATWSDEGDLCDPLSQAMIAYYFHTSDGSPLTQELISFSELPDGQFYTAAFQGYTGQKLRQHFGDDIGAFADAARRAGGTPTAIADAGFAFAALPRVRVAAVCWLGDEDFPSSYRILFDSSIRHHLPTDACAILGSMLTGRLIESKA